VLKGAIDHVASGEVGGWIHSESKSLRDCKVLAFLNDKCIGGGQVDIYREDLADAGLGDGYVGFRFPVTLSSPADFPVVVVKLEGSDAWIVQRTARVIDRGSIASPTSLSVRSAASVEWMRGRGWLDQPEYDFLRLMQRFGVYDLNLRDGKPEEQRNGTGVRDPMEATKEMFDLLCAADSTVTTETFFGPEVQLEEMVKSFRRGAIEPIISLWGPQAGTISVVEGSNQDLDSEMSKAGLDGAVAYRIGPDRLLFLDLRCRLQAQLVGQVRSYTIAVEL
jgi:hypothetical protein